MRKVKIFKSFFTSLLALILCLGSVAPAFAEGVNTGEETAPAKLAVEKHLTMPAGTTTPNAKFDFILTPKSVDGIKTEAALGTMPVPAASVVYNNLIDSEPVNGVKTVTVTIEDMLDGIEFPHAGVYVYTLTEKKDTSSIKSNETVTYSGGSYTITVYVDNAKDGSVYVSDVTSIVNIIDNESQSPDTKSDVVFTNTYSVISGGTDPSQDSALTISKNVEGKYADKTKYFTFEIELEKTAFETGEITYNLYLFEDKALLTTIPTEVYSSPLKDDNGYNYIKITAGKAISVNLKHGQSLSVLLATVGTTYTVVEKAAASYTGSVLVGGVTINGNANTDLSTGAHLIGIDTSSAAFTNKQVITTPTGISMNILPFVMILVLAAAAFIIFVIAKSRKKNYSTED